MKIVIQRVKQAAVSIEGKTVGQIQQGLLIFLGVSREDTQSDAEYLIRKLLNLRIFEDQDGKMNHSALEQKASLLVVSQFTLYGNCDKGRRPSFDQAADPQKGEQLYNYFVQHLRHQHPLVETGVFRAMMDVSLINDGPVTFIIDS